jgi:hypothetical protein
VTDLVDRALLDAEEGWDVFVGIGLRKCPMTLDITRCSCRIRGADHVSRLPAAWADLDVRCEGQPDKPHESVGSVIAMLSESPQRPSMLIGSGTGVHAYWVLPEPTYDIEHVVALNRAIRGRLNGDNAIDAARVLRLAGTANHKHGRPLPVRLLKAQW